jgi:hypothetical protein
MTGQPRTPGSQPNGDLFRRAFLKAVSAKFPSWQAAIIASAQLQSPIEIEPPNGDGRPFTIEIRGDDTVTLFPCCDFGLDYIFTANNEDLEERPLVVFAKVLSYIADFIDGRTVVAIKRPRWLGWGANVRFVPTPDADAARRAGASIIAWPQAIV